MPDIEIRVYGLADLRRTLGQMERIDDRNELRSGLKAAGEVVTRDAQGRIRSRTGRSKQGIRTVSGGNRTYVAEGGARFPHLNWLDFGARTPMLGNPRSVGPWAGSGPGPDGGRFIYPAIDARERQIVLLVQKAISEALRRIGL